MRFIFQKLQGGLLLMMTCEPAVELRLSLPMAIDAETHFKIHRDQAIEFLHVTMALDTIHITANMRLVIEFDMIRNIKDSNPRYRCLCVEVPPLLHDLRVLRNNRAVAEKALLDGRNPGILRSVDKGVAESTTDLLDSCMDPMAEIDRLLRSNRPGRIDIVKIEHATKDQGQHDQPDSPSTQGKETS